MNVSKIEERALKLQSQADQFANEALDLKFKALKHDQVSKQHGNSDAGSAYQAMARLCFLGSTELYAKANRYQKASNKFLLVALRRAKEG